MLGISAVGLFGLALMVFSVPNPRFDPFADYVSRLGAVGQPYAPWWNLSGFLAVAILLADFGFVYGRILRHRPAERLAGPVGVGFGAAGVPVDLADEGSPVSAAHVVAICLGLAAREAAA